MVARPLTVPRGGDRASRPPTDRAPLRRPGYAARRRGSGRAGLALPEQHKRAAHAGAVVPAGIFLPLLFRRGPVFRAVGLSDRRRPDGKPRTTGLFLALCGAPDRADRSALCRLARRLPDHELAWRATSRRRFPLAARPRRDALLVLPDIHAEFLFGRARHVGTDVARRHLDAGNRGPFLCAGRDPGLSRSAALDGAGVAGNRRGSLCSADLRMAVTRVGGDNGAHAPAPRRAFRRRLLRLAVASAGGARADRPARADVQMRGARARRGRLPQRRVREFARSRLELHRQRAHFRTGHACLRGAGLRIAVMARAVHAMVRRALLRPLYLPCRNPGPGVAYDLHIAAQRVVARPWVAGPEPPPRDHLPARRPELAIVRAADPAIGGS